MTGANGELFVLVTLLLGGAFLRSTNVLLVALNAAELPVDLGHDPGAGDDAGGLEGEAEDEKGIGEGDGQESDGEGRSNELPGDGSQDRSDEGAEETGVEKLLNAIGDAEDVLVDANANVESGDAGNDEEAEGDTELTTDHEAGQVAALALEEEVTGHLGALRVSLLVLGHFGDSEEGNLHALEEADDGHEDEEEDDGGGTVDALPHGGLALEECLECDGQGISENEGERTRAQKKRFCWRFRGGSAEMMGLRAILATTIWKK